MGVAICLASVLSVWDATHTCAVLKCMQEFDIESVPALKVAGHGSGQRLSKIMIAA